PIDPFIAQATASGIGLINGIIEIAQIDNLISTVPGLKKVFRKAQKKAIKKIVANKTLWGIAKRASKKYVGNVAFETGTEIWQESNMIAGKALSIELHNMLYGSDIPRSSWEESVDRILETAKQSTQSFSVLALPGNVIQVSKEVMPTKTITPEGKVARIAPIQRTTEIKPRVDVKNIGKDKKTQADAKPAMEEKVESVDLTTQEQADFAKAEQGVDYPETVKPKLYIGNMTQRMKKVVEKATGKAKEKVGEFLDGAFPTKRTEVEMSSNEALDALIELEEKLDSKVENNQINTNNDIARASADHGDIQALRKSLGLPQTPMPFRVVRDKGHKVVTIENVKERVSKAVTPSKLQIVQMTKIEQLNLAMRKFAQGVKVGWKELAHIKYLQRIELAKQRLRKQITESIKGDASKSIDFFYREAIKKIQSQIDFKSDGKTDSKNALRKLIEENPDRADEIPSKLLDTLDKRDISTLTITDLKEIDAEIKRLKKLGRLKSKLMVKRRNKSLSDTSSVFNETIDKAKGTVRDIKRKVSMVRSFGLRDPRIFDILDGLKNFTGPIYDFFYGLANDARNTELRMVDQRQTPMMERMRELGITLNHLYAKRIVGDLVMTVDEMMGVYAGWKNPESKAAIKYGGIKNKKGEYVEVTNDIYNKIEESLSENEKIWADTIIQEYSEHYDRTRNAVISVENRDPGRSENYTKIRRLKHNYKSQDAEVADEMGRRDFFKNLGPSKKHTINRKQIPDEYQQPIDLSLTNVWLGEVRRQEHYISHAQIVKDMRVVADGMSDKIASVYGDTYNKAIDAYINRIANPDYYRTFDGLENLSRTLRKNTAVAYLAFNLVTIGKQAPSLLFYWGNSSLGDLLTSLVDTAINPKKVYDFVSERDPQIAHASIEREIEELKHSHKNTYVRVVNKIGRTGLYGIMAMDRIVRTIGWNAVYNAQTKKGATPKAA
ncbi:MAG: hypothetical protein DRJ03_30115, partial [Chloroflexi bacterium]